MLLTALLAFATTASAKQPGKRPEDHVRGQELWERSCWSCHGRDAGGHGPAAAALQAAVPDLRGRVDRGAFDAWVDEIEHGKGDMPAFAEEFNARDARRILIYLERLEQERTATPGPDAPAATP